MNPTFRFVALWFACLVVANAPKLQAQDPPQREDEARTRSTKLEFDPSDLDQTSRFLWSRIAALHQKGKRAADALAENGLNDDLLKEYERDIKSFDEQINQNSGKIVVWKMKVELITAGDVHLRPVQSAAPLGALVVQLDEDKAFRKVQENGLITSHRPGDAIPLFPRSKCTGGHSTSLRIGRGVTKDYAKTLKRGDEVRVAAIFSSAHKYVGSGAFAESEDVVYLSVGEARILEPGAGVPKPGALGELGPPPSRSVPTGMKFALIPAGDFMMGKNKDKRFSDVQHRVRITRPFYLGIYEVTQGQYQAVTGEKPSSNNGSDDLPVEQVSWLDAVKFCNKLSEREHFRTYYKIEGNSASILGGNGYRLPTEAEWEYACRAGSTTAFFFGDDESSIGDYAWFALNSGYKTHPVGQKKPNRFGLYDMLGNVYEWCWDVSSGDSDGSAVDDPTGPEKPGERRVIRGGNYDRTPGWLHSGYRHELIWYYKTEYTGFRVARTQSDR